MYSTQTLKPRIYNIIVKNLGNPNLSGAFIATELGVNRMYVHRKLVEYHQMNARDYICSVRMKKAKKLLKETNMPIKEIATKVGYRDCSFFTKKFKQETNITPSKYRKSMV